MDLDICEWRKLKSYKIIIQLIYALSLILIYVSNSRKRLEGKEIIAMSFRERNSDRPSDPSI